MAANPQKFAELLTEGVHRVRINESKSVQIVQDELGYMLGREGGSAVEYWRKGHIPPKLGDVEQLGRSLAVRGRLERSWLESFLACAEHPAPDRVGDEVFGLDGQASVAPRPSLQTPLPLIDSYAAFIVGPPIVHPGKFFGREQLLKRIFNAWRHYPLQSIAVVGPKRSGKSSLLHHVKNIFAVGDSQLRPGQWKPAMSGVFQNPEAVDWVYVDFQDIRMSSQERLAQHILETLGFPLPALCDLNSFMDVMIENLSRPTIILMDEIGAALAAPALDMRFWWSLRSLATNLTGGNLGFLIASQEPPVDLANQKGKPSPFFNIFGQVLDVGPIEEKAAKELLQSSPVTVSMSDMDWMLQESQRWPILLQILGQSFLNSADEQPDGTEWREDGLSRLKPYRYLLDDTPNERA